jgi:hypothetical protein
MGGLHRQLADGSVEASEIAVVTQAGSEQFRAVLQSLIAIRQDGVRKLQCVPEALGALPALVKETGATVCGCTATPRSRTPVEPP